MHRKPDKMYNNEYNDDSEDRTGVRNQLEKALNKFINKRQRNEVRNCSHALGKDTKGSVVKIVNSMTLSLPGVTSM